MNHLITFPAEYFIIIASIYALLRVLIMYERKYYIRYIVIIFGSAVAAWVCAHFLKNVIHHPRPDLTLALVRPHDPYSFPSGHTAFMFGLAFAMHSFDKRAAKILFALALCTGVARVLAGVHYWYDIVGGVIIAYGVATFVVYFSKKIFKTA